MKGLLMVQTPTTAALVSHCQKTTPPTINYSPLTSTRPPLAPSLLAFPCEFKCQMSLFFVYRSSFFFNCLTQNISIFLSSSTHKYIYVRPTFIKRGMRNNILI